MEERSHYKITAENNTPPRASGTRIKALLLLLGTVAAFLPLLFFNGERYSVDSPSILLYGEWSQLGAFLDSYRYFGALIAHLYYYAGHDPIGNCLPDTILFILLAAVGTTILVKTVSEQLKIDRWLPVAALDLAAVLAIENVWFCEILTFPESIFLSGVGVLLCDLAVVLFIRYRNVKGLAASAVCLILSTAVYQQFITVFTIFAVAELGCEILTNERITVKSAFLRYAGTAAFVLGSGVVYLLIGKAVCKAFGMDGGSRVATTASDVIQNALYYLTHQRSFLKGRGYFDTEIMTVSVLFVAAVWFVIFALNVKKKKRLAVGLIVLLAFALAYCSGFLPGVVSQSHDTRAVFGVFSVFFLFVCGIVTLCKNNRIVLSSVACILAVFLAANAVETAKTAIDQKAMTRSDLQIVDSVIREIEDYEERSGSTVKTVYYCYDLSPTPARTWRVFSFDFSMSSVFTLRSSKYTPEVREALFEFVEMPEDIYKQHFEGRDWQELDLDEQLFFVGESAYLCIY